MMPVMVSEPVTVEQALLYLAPASVRMPEEIVALARWIDSHGHVFPGYKGVIGTLHEDYDVGTNIILPEWDPRGILIARLGSDDQCDMLWPFARMDATGQTAALWATDGGYQVVSFGGYEDEVITRTPLDFLRLLAMGYTAASDALEDPTKTPDAERAEYDHDLPFRNNELFRAWVSDTFGVDIPETAASIIPAKKNRYDPDEFADWVQSTSTHS